jgi:hypothetical protein
VPLQQSLCSWHGFSKQQYMFQLDIRMMAQPANALKSASRYDAGHQTCVTSLVDRTSVAAQKGQRQDLQ